MARATAKKAESNSQQVELFFDPKRDMNPFWSSSLFSDVYLKNDLPREYKTLWENDEIGGFYDFYQGFINLCHDLEQESFESWREADTVKNWIVPVMTLLGWENNSERHQNSYIDNTSFTVEEKGRRQVYRPDLIYFDRPQHKAYTQKEKDQHSKLREARDRKTGSKMVVEAKYWNRLSTNTDKFKSKESDDSASGLGPELQTLKYMEIFELDFGILTDGKTWRIFHQELSQGLDKRCYEFDLGNLRELALDLDSNTNEQKFKNYAKYFYYFFSKPSIVTEEKNRTAPFLYQILEYSKKYAHSIEEDLKKRFIISMGLTCNALQRAATDAGTKVDLDTIRNVAESHLFNILFTKSCEVRRVLPIQSINYLKLSLHEVIEYLTEMKFDPDKNWDDFLRDFRFGEAFGGKKFCYEGFEIFNRFINLYEVIHDGTDKNKDFGFEIQGFKESIFSKEEWSFAKKHKICNKDMIAILFNLNFIESQSPDRKYQQIPYSYFTPRQLGSIYESFLEFRIEKADSDMVFTKGQWKPANLKSNVVKNLKLADNHFVEKGELFFSPDNTDRKMTGSYYTPDYVVKFMIEKALGNVKELNSSEILKLKICDPAIGSGHFLAGTLDFLLQEYRNKWSQENLTDIEESFNASARKILHSCLYGIDINPRAVKLAKMSLWLLTAHPGEKLEELDDQIINFDSLQDTKEWSKILKIMNVDGFNYIVGNPPYYTVGKGKGQVNISEEKIEYFKTNFPLGSEYKINYYSMFMELGPRLLKPNGVQAYIVPSSFLLNKYFQRIREYFLNEQQILSIDWLNYKVFENAETGGNCIAITKNHKFQGEDFLVRKVNSMTEINSTEYLNCKKSLILEYVDSKITCDPISANLFLKIAKRVSSKTLGDSFSFYNGIKTGDNARFIADSKKSKLHEIMITGRDFNRFLQPSPKRFVLFDKKELWSNTDEKNLRVKNKVLVRQTGDCIISTIDKKGVLYGDTVHAIWRDWSSEAESLVLSCYLNSKISNWFFQMLNPEKGRAFAEVKIAILKEIPFDVEFLKNKKLQQLAASIFNKPDDKRLLEALDKEFSKLFDLSQAEQKTIEETISENGTNEADVYEVA